MSELRTKTVSTKVTEAEHAMLTALAGPRVLGEWVRDVLFKAALSDPTGAAQLTILEEVIALRRVVLNLGYALARGEPITPDQMRGLIEDADAEKNERARARLSAG